ncbi:hypothetical protein FRC01_001245 [Tulasnella sp. 417]|nr:hypothetical protein FRC01_001245 [Tulasnella sp. 417]
MKRHPLSSHHESQNLLQAPSTYRPSSALSISQFETSTPSLDVAYQFIRHARSNGLAASNTSAGSRRIRLDLLFPAEHPEEPRDRPNGLQTPIETLWAELREEKIALPPYLFVLGLCRQVDGTMLDTVVRPALQHVVDQIKALEGLKICNVEPDRSPVFQSWTQYFISTARFLGFLYSIPPNETCSQIHDELQRLHSRLVEITCMYIVYRYTVSTMAEFISTHPKATSKPTISSLFATLGTAWMNSMFYLFNPLNERPLVDVLGASWARQKDDMQPDHGLPFFQLHDVAQRWLVISPTPQLEQAILELASAVETTPEPFQALTTYEQYTVIAAVFALTESPNRSAPDLEWTYVVESIIEALQATGGEPMYEKEHAPIAPPPTRVAPSADCSQMQQSPTGTPQNSLHVQPTIMTNQRSATDPSDERQSNNETGKEVLQDDRREDALPERRHYSQPKSRRKGGSRWRPGDVIKFSIGGVSKKLKIRQRGPNPSDLVLTWPKSREPVLTKNGSPIPLPPFNNDMLVASGPFMPSLDTDCFIRERPLPPFIPFHEILSGMHDEYFKDLFAKNPETPFGSPEPEGGEFDDLPEDVELEELRRRLESRRRFREDLNLPPGAQDLADEARVASLLGSAARADDARSPTSPEGRIGSTSFATGIGDGTSTALTPGQPSSNGENLAAGPATGAPVSGALLAETTIPGDSISTQTTAEEVRDKRKRKRSMPDEGTSENTLQLNEASCPTSDDPARPDHSSPRRSRRPRKAPGDVNISSTSRAGTKAKPSASTSKGPVSGEEVQRQSLREEGGSLKTRSSSAKGKQKEVQPDSIVTAPNVGSSSSMNTRSKSKATRPAMEADADIDQPAKKKTRSKH